MKPLGQLRTLLKILLQEFFQILFELLFYNFPAENEATYDISIKLFRIFHLK